MTDKKYKEWRSHVISSLQIMDVDSRLSGAEGKLCKRMYRVDNDIISSAHSMANTIVTNRTLKLHELLSKVYGYDSL